MAKVQEYLDALSSRSTKPPLRKSCGKKEWTFTSDPRGSLTERRSRWRQDHQVESISDHNGCPAIFPPINGSIAFPILLRAHLDSKRLPRSMIAVGGGPIARRLRRLINGLVPGHDRRRTLMPMRTRTSSIATAGSATIVTWQPSR